MYFVGKGPGPGEKMRKNLRQIIGEMSMRICLKEFGIVIN